MHTFVDWVINNFTNRSGPIGDFASDLYQDWDEECLYGISSAQEVYDHIRRCHSMCGPAESALFELARNYGTPLEDVQDSGRFRYRQLQPLANGFERSVRESLPNAFAQLG